MTWEIKSINFLKVKTDNGHDAIVAVDKIAFAVGDTERGTNCVRVTFMTSAVENYGPGARG